MSFWQQIKNQFKPDTTPAESNSGELPCFWQVDMHSHLVPGIDDGVQDDEQALTCLKQLSEWGVQKVITTPHVSRDIFPNSSATLRAGDARLQALVAEHAIPITVAVAAEYMLDDFFPDLIEQHDLLSFGAERYVLFETGWSSAPFQLEATIFRLQTHGYTPVLAHPERYTYYHDDIAALHHLREAGCLFQLNWLSATGRYGDKVRKQTLALLKAQAIDFLGSDLHRAESLPNYGTLFSASEFELFRQQPLRNQGLL